MTTIEAEGNTLRITGSVAEVREALATLSRDFGNMRVKDFIAATHQTEPNGSAVCPFGDSVAIGSVEDLDRHLRQEHPDKYAVMIGIAEQVARKFVIP